MTPLDIAREIFPNYPDDWLDYTIWNKTAFPLNSTSEMRLQLFELRDALTELKQGDRLCELCCRVAKKDEWICDYCDGLLANGSNGQYGS